VTSSESAVVESGVEEAAAAVMAWTRPAVAPYSFAAAFAENEVATQARYTQTDNDNNSNANTNPDAWKWNLSSLQDGYLLSH
jgi:hypothetical protein